MVHTSPCREEEHWVEQQEQFRWWRPTRRQLLWAGGIAIAFLIIVICGYLFR
jgi:hypothetical protein